MSYKIKQLEVEDVEGDQPRPILRAVSVSDGEARTWKHPSDGSTLRLSSEPSEIPRMIVHYIATTHNEEQLALDATRRWLFRKLLFGFVIMVVWAVVVVVI